MGKRRKLNETKRGSKLQGRTNGVPELCFPYRRCARPIIAAVCSFHPFPRRIVSAEPATGSRLTLFATLNSFDVCQPPCRIRSRVKLIKTKGTMKRVDGMYVGQNARDYTCLPRLCHCSPCSWGTLKKPAMELTF